MWDGGCWVVWLVAAALPDSALASATGASPASAIDPGELGRRPELFRSLTAFVGPSGRCCDLAGIQLCQRSDPPACALAKAHAIGSRRPCVSTLRGEGPVQSYGR